MIKKFLTTLAVTTAVSSVVFGAVAPAEAGVLSFGTGGMKFDRDTNVNFRFLKSQGAFTASLFNSNGTAATLLFKEIKASDNGSANDYQGTFGNAVTSPTGVNPVAFTFLKGINYNLILDSGDGGAVSSATNAKFSSSNPFASGGVDIWFDDNGANFDEDYNDFGVNAQAVPEPMALAGLAIVGASMAARRRQHQA